MISRKGPRSQSWIDSPLALAGAEGAGKIKKVFHGQNNVSPYPDTGVGTVHAAPLEPVGGPHWGTGAERAAQSSSGQLKNHTCPDFSKASSAMDRAGQGS